MPKPPRSMRLIASAMHEIEDATMLDAAIINEPSRAASAGYRAASGASSG